MYILSMYKRITVLFTSLCLFSQGSQAGADESFERKGRCQDLGVFLGQSGNGFDPSFDWIDMTGINVPFIFGGSTNENIGEMDHHLRW